jgi:uncharacterized membrane protein
LTLRVAYTVRCETRLNGDSRQKANAMNLPQPEPEFVPTVVAPCNTLAVTAALGWLAAGWRDFLQAKTVSLVYGLAVFAVSALVSWAAWKLGGWVMLISAMTGFVFVAPVLAFALYSVSRQLCEGREPSLAHTLLAMRRPFSHAMVYALVLLVIFLVWARAASMVHIFFPIVGSPEWPELLLFLAIGSAVGSIFAIISFAASAYSIPMLANRDVDIVTAIVSSINAVLRNKTANLFWAVLIVMLTGVGLLTGLLGLIVIIPWLAYSTWHGYRATLDVSEWPVLDSESFGS